MPPPPLVTTPPSKPPPTKPAKTSEVVIGVDGITGGYNPHTVADQSAVTTALGALLLPSVFRPAADGTPQMDRTLMRSATVTKYQPYTVTYELRGDASWSDGPPIAAEDFLYLWEQMRRAPGVIDSAGYRLIDNITARDAGKVVEVTFDKPYPGWRSLFNGLLPAHLLKDAPGGWDAALEDGFPATGGPFAVSRLDQERGEIQLERNERYWEQPAALEKVVFRRADQVGVVDALRRGNDQLALLRTDSVGLSLLGTLGNTVAVHTVPRSATATVLLRPVGEDMSDARVRRAISALLDRDALVATGTRGGPGSTLRAEAQVLSPTAPGYRPTRPGGVSSGQPELAQAEAALQQAGYTRGAGIWMRDGRPLSLVIAAPAERESYVSMARELQRQLVNAGIQAKVETPSADQLFTESLASVPTGQRTTGAVHLAVVPRPVGGDPATVLASNFGCLQGESAVAGAQPTNPVGFCDASVQPTIEAALSGAVPVAETLTTIEPVLWREALTVPLFQEADSLAVRPELTGVDVGRAPSGPFDTAVAWRRAPN
nr:ABC transporter family substrate-binding protein [Herbihabitans rhizosphaerae]